MDPDIIIYCDVDDLRGCAIEYWQGFVVDLPGYSEECRRKGLSEVEVRLQLTGVWTSNWRVAGWRKEVGIYEFTNFKRES